jgi:hypothetical protein
MVSSTQLKKLISSSPAHLKHWLNNPTDPTEAMILGQAAHKYCLEWALFDDSFVVAQKFDRRTKEGKAKYTEFEMLHCGKTIITENQMSDIMGMQASISNHPLCKTLFQEGHLEVAFLWNDPESGLNCRVKPDFIHSSNVLVDFKTCKDASPKGFERQAANLNYHVQMAFYGDGIQAVTETKIEHHIIVAIETSAPYAIGVYRYDNFAIDQGRNQYRKALNLLAECLFNKEFPAYSNDIQDLFLPTYKMEV